MKHLLFIFILITSNQTFSQQTEYSTIINQITKKQQAYKSTYIKATKTKKDSILSKARQFITQKMVSEIFPAWYGTPWDFNGTTYHPQKGFIACGYFVTTTLDHAGFKIPRYKWAQLSAENIIKKFTSKNKIKRMSNKSIVDVADYIKSQGKGLYVVGLDCHVGFIYNNGKDIKFIHSNYYEPDIGVMSQNISSYNPLNHSKYRVFGKLFDDKMIESWILNNKFIGYTY